MQHTCADHILVPRAADLLSPNLSQRSIIRVTSSKFSGGMAEQETAAPSAASNVYASLSAKYARVSTHLVLDASSIDGYFPVDSSR